MRTHQQLLYEIEIRKALDLPRIELTEEERQRAFGDPALYASSECNGACKKESFLDKFLSGLFFLMFFFILLFF